MIYTVNHRYKDVIRFKQQQGSSTWLILGGTSPWADDENPPTPNPGTNLTIPDAFCAKKANVQMAIEDPAGVIVYTDAFGVDRKFTEILTVEDALAEQATFIVLTGVVTGFQLTGQTTFRKIGFATDLEPAVGFEDETFLLAANVANWGTLECLQYEQPYPVVAASSYEFRNVLEY